MTSATLGTAKQDPSVGNNASQSLWLCIRFAHLALNSVNVRLNSADYVAVSDQHHIVQLSQAAELSGIKTGQSINHALMLNPNLRLVARDKQSEQRILKTMCAWAYRFTSQIHRYNEHTLLLEIGRSLSLFHGIRHLQNLIVRSLDEHNLDAQFGLGKTPKSSYLLSFSPSHNWADKHFDDALNNASLQHLALDSTIIDKLLNCGFECLGDVLSLPQRELAQRFGPDLVHYLAQLTGCKADPQTLFSPSESFKQQIDFAEPINNRTWIEQQVDRLLKDLVRFVVQKNRVCRSFKWRFFNDDAQLVQTVVVRLASTKTDFDVFKQLTDLKLSQLSMQWQFTRIELSSNELVCRHQFNQDLFNPNADQENLKQLFSSLQSRLGDDAVFQVDSSAQHLPELAMHQRPAFKQTLHGKESAPQSTLFDQPLWLFDTPKQLKHRQHHVFYKGVLKLIHGPNRISSHWWSRQQSRDYYIARQRTGRLLWIFHEPPQRRWFLHGLFA